MAPVTTSALGMFFLRHRCVTLHRLPPQVEGVAEEAVTAAVLVAAAEAAAEAAAAPLEAEVSLLGERRKV